MHFIDYLPWPAYMLILFFSVVGIIKYIIFNVKLNLQEKIGGFMIIIGVIAIVMFKISDETSYNIMYHGFNIIFVTPIIGIIGFFVLIGGTIRRTKDPEQKRKLKLYYTFLCIAFGLVGILFLVF